MGNQHSVGQNGVVFQNNGQYIVPNKLNQGKTEQQEEIVNNIFGINDPTLLTRSYWAKQQSKSPFNNKDGRSPAKSRLYTESLIRANRQFQPQMSGPYEDEADRKQEIMRSIVNDLKVDHLLESAPTRNLSKNTSYSIIHKLNKYDDEIQSHSPFKNSQIIKTNDLRVSKYTKNKQNFNYLLGSGNKNHSKSQTKQNQREDMEKSLSVFKGTQKLSQQNSRRKVLDDVTLRSQINNIFGLESITQEKCEQLTDRLEEQLKSMRKTEPEDQKSRLTTERSQRNNQENQKVFNNYSKEHYRGQNEYCEQTFSRFQEQNAYPIYLSKSSQKESSEKSSQKTSLKKANMQKYKGLNQDSHNQSLMKVMKRITDINLNVDNLQDNKSSQTIKINRTIVEDASEIMDENNKYQRLQNCSVHSKKGSQQKSSKKNYEVNQDEARSGFKFDLKQVNCSQNSFKSHFDLQSKIKFSQQYESKQSSNKSFKQQSQKLSQKNSNSNKMYSNHLPGPNSLSNHYCLQNDIYQTESSQGLDDGYSEKFQFARNQSPRSLAMQQRIMTRQRSCSGRLIETQKISQKSKKQSEISYKNFDFSKKLYLQNEDRSVYSKKYHPEQSQKPEKFSTKDYQLLLKISTLQEELKRLKSREEIQKFESRRYSPVKQQKMKISVKNNSDNGSKNQEDIGTEQNKFCINNVSSTKPLKRRSQYFKLKVK